MRRSQLPWRGVQQPGLAYCPLHARVSISGGEHTRNREGRFPQPFVLCWRPATSSEIQVHTIRRALVFVIDWLVYAALQQWTLFLSCARVCWSHNLAFIPSSVYNLRLFPFPVSTSSQIYQRLVDDGSSIKMRKIYLSPVKLSCPYSPSPVLSCLHVTRCMPSCRLRNSLKIK